MVPLQRRHRCRRPLLQGLRTTPSPGVGASAARWEPLALTATEVVESRRLGVNLKLRFRPRRPQLVGER